MAPTHLVLTDLVDRIPRPAFETLVAVARDRHGPALDRLLLAEAEERRRKLIEGLLPQLESREHRLLLGLIWTGAARDVILELLHRSSPAPIGRNGLRTGSTRWPRYTRPAEVPVSEGTIPP